MYYLLSQIIINNTNISKLANYHIMPYATWSIVKYF